MKKATGVAAIIGLGISLTWAAGQVGLWLGLPPQHSAQAEEQSSASPGAPPGGGGVPPSTEAMAGSPAGGEQQPGPPPEFSAEVASIEEDLARIEEALQSDEVLEEFTPSEPLSADNPIDWPTDI